MAGFQSIVVTQKGQALLAKAQDGAPIVMTRWQIGTGALPVGTDLTAREALVSELMDLPISDVEISGRQATVKGQFINTGLSQFRWNELGLFAKSGSSEEILYAYSNSFGDGEDIEAGEVRVREFVFGATISMGTSATIDAQIDKGLIFVTKKELEAVAARDGYISGNDTATAVMGIPCAGGPLALDNIRGNTILGGTPAYDAPVSMESVKGPLKLHISGKNLIDFSKATKTDTMYGISYTISDDGVIALSGTANRGSAVYVTPFVKAGMVNGFVLPAGNYHLSGLSKDYLDNSMRIYFNSYTPDGSQQIGTGITADKSGISFSLSSSLMITLNIRIEDGVNVDGVTITPQIEVGSQATDYQTPSNTAVEIPLLGTDGQILEPLREVSGKLTGESGAAYPFLDRIVRHGGVWAVERNVREYDLSEASWTKNTDYMYPYIGDYAIKSGTISNYVKCTHFPARGDASSQSAGAWLGTFFVIGNDVLPNGADTTVEKMKTYCQTQDSNGTPVKVCVPIDPPVYEELHQDVQVILNTLCVPGGTCSVWFEGDILPSGADIGLPRGDYPCSGVEGAYRWLAELSSPLPIPTRDDLYAWALEQQRGGVFATDGSTTTKNVPESGDLTGILSVAEQGTDVSMIVFGPTGKIHTATRMAGVWRGWTTLYSPLNKPNPADLGAAAADHNHSADQITSGILPLARGGLGASTWSTALDNLHGMARQATYYNETSAVDIDAITDGLALVPTAASKGCPISGSFVFIMQMFYGNLDTTRSRTQIAFPYAGGSGIAVRSYDSNKSVWSEWNLVYTANTPPPVMNGATSSKAGTAGLATAPPAGAQNKYLRGDGTWQTPYTHPSYTAKVSGLYKITVDKTGHISGAEAIHTGRAARFVIGTSTAGWTEADCDYLCDGTADEVEIKAAIAALPSGGGNILLLDGPYNITSPITIEKNNVSLHGCGPATVLARRFNSTSDDGPTGLIDCLCADCTVFNISIDGNKSEYPSLINRGIFARESSVNVTIEEVSISDSRDGIYFGKIKGGCIKGCNIINSVNAIHIYNAIGIDISHNNINTTTSEAVACTGAKLIEISGNHITGSSKNGIRTTDGTTMCNIVNNICLDNAGGISLEDTSMCNVSGNLCMRGSGTPSDYDSTNATIRATSGSANNIISGNLVMGKDVDDSGTGNLVVNNKFE